MSLPRPLRIFVPHCSDLLTDHRPHGDGLIAQGFLRHLAARGHQLHVAAAEVDLKSPLPEKVRLYPVARRGDGLRARMYYMAEVRRLFRQLQRETAFDLVHQLNPVFTGVSLSLVGTGVPVVLGPYITRWPDDPSAIHASSRTGEVALQLGRRALAALQQRAADCLLLTTPAAVDRIPHAQQLKGRIEHLPHGIDSTFFSPAANWQSEPMPPAGSGEILFIANVVRRKGIFDLLTAFATVAELYPHARLTVAGGGSELGEAKSQAATMVPADRVAFLGAQSRTEALALFRHADIYCLPSHGEPYGMTAVEAMSCGRPVVATDAGGLGCLIDAQGGVKVPVGNPAALAAALGTLLSDPERRKRMGEHNRERVLTSMSWERVIERLEAIYGAVMDSKRGGSGEDVLLARGSAQAASSQDFA